MADNDAHHDRKVTKSDVPEANDGVSYFRQILDEIRSSPEENASQPSSPLSFRKLSSSKPVAFDELLQQEQVRTQKLKNDKKANENGIIADNQKLKKRTLNLLFILLFTESATLFVIAFFQGFSFKSFELDTWTLRIIVVATLAQISAMLTIAVRHLFPTRSKKS